MAEEQTLNAVELATELTIAWLGNQNNRVQADDVPQFLRTMHATVTELSGGSSAAPEPAEEAAPTEASASGGAWVRVAGTDGQGVSLRSRPSTTAQRVTVAAEGARLQVIGEDTQSEGRTWRNVRHQGGASGWVAAQYLRAE